MIIVVICWHWHPILIRGIEKWSYSSVLLPPRGQRLLAPCEWERKEAVIGENDFPLIILLLRRLLILSLYTPVNSKSFVFEDSLN